MADWDVISEERVATPPAPRPQRNQAAADPWAVVDEFDPNEGVGAEAQGVARPSSLGDTIFNALTRGWERAKSGFQSFDDSLQLRGEAVSRKSLGEILTQRTPRPDPGSAMMSGLGIILDLVQKGGRAVTSMVEGEDAVAAKDQAARAEIARLGVRQALAADANPSSALADQISRLNTGSFLGDMGEARQLIFGDGVLEGLQRLGALALEYGAENLPGSLPGMAGAIGGGLFGGLPGAVGGGAAGFGSSSAAQQYGLTILEFLDGRGVNVRDAAAVEEALADPQILQQALDYAGTKTGISSSAEAVAGALGPGMLIPRRLMGSALGRELTNALVAQPIAQGVIGTAGDVGADMAVGEDPRIAAALIQNVLGEAGLSPMETLGARGAARARERAESNADAARAAKAAGFTPVDEAPDLGRPAPADPAPPPADSAPQAPGDVMAGAAAPDLTPRQPPAADVPEGTSREQLIDEWRAASTPEERAAAAARIAAYDAQRRDAEDLGDAGLRGSPEEGGPASPGVRAGVQADSADGQAGARAVPGELPPSDPGAAEGQAPRMVRDAPAGLTDPYQDTDDAAIREALGPAAAGITVHRTISDIRPEDRERIGLTENDTDVEGFYDPDTGRVHIIEANLATEVVDPETGERWTMTRDQRRVWVAAHERSGHAGVRGMFAEAEGSNAAGSQALARELDRASQNEVIAAIVAAMEKQRPERGRILVEEAIVEIAAAVRTGDYGHIQQRYGVEVPAAARAGLRGTIARLVEAIKRAFGRVGRGFSDADIYRLIEGAHRYAQRGEVRGTSRRAEQQRGPVAQRAYHGSPTRGIDRFRLEKIGTGEGNQSFGWGLYFTGKREVGDTYRRSLSPVGRIAGGALGDRLIQEQGSQRAALEVISRMRRAGVNSAERMLGEKRWSRGGGEPDFVRARMMEELDAAEAFIRRNAGRGQLYQVDLPEDHELLNYDAPLDKQPEKVRAAIERLLPPDAQERLILTRNPRGVDYYNAIGRHISEQKYGFPFPAGEDINMAREASLALAAEGVPGLRYLNGESRSADGGIDPGPTAYNYVIWDESRIGTPEPLIASRASRLLRNLTPEEQRKVTDKVAAKIEEQLTKLPPKREMAAVAIAGQAKRGWYRQSAETISAVFGPDAPLFAGLLAATSPQISVEGNLKNALAIWRDWIAAGRPTGEDEILAVMRSALRRSFGGSLRAWEPNAVRALQGRGILSGPKVNSFMRNLLGDVEEVTNDAWMANFANVSQTIFKGAINVRETDPGKGAGYLAMNARVREVARELTRLTGETWTPAEVQETIWSWAKTITEMADSAGEIRSAEELVLDRAVTDELIASTPDFGTLFTMPEYRQILEEAGYGDQLNEVVAQRDAARAAGEEPGARRQASPFAEEDQLRLERRAARRIDALRRARREAAAVEEEAAEEVPFSRGKLGRFEPLPGAPKIKGATGPDKRLVRIAERYAKENGIELRRQRAYVKADPERGARIAEAYEAMEHAPNDPRVRAAYEELIRQTVAQYRALEDAGYRFWFADPENDPYQGNPWNAMRDLRANQSMAVFPTVAGFGSGATDIDVSDNPLMADTGIRWPFGTPDGELRPVLANDLFRAVHDAFGHGLEGAGFRADGEENAWQAHVRLFTGAAVAAITTETRGQNSWLNFGPYGESNRTASVEDTIFADQKTGLLPEWTWTEGRADDEEFVASRGTRNPQIDTPEFRRWFGDSKVVDENGEPLVVYHGTPGPAFDQFDPNRKGVTTVIGIPVDTQRHGFFFAENAEFARSFADQPRARGQGAVMPVYLKIERPLVLPSDAPPYWKDIEALVEQGIDRDWLERKARDPSTSWEMFDEEDGAFFVEAVKAAGFDGVLFQEEGVGLDPDAPPQDVWVAFDPTQIKSATDNSGAFDPSNPSIIASRGFSAKRRQPDAVSVDAYHYSTQEGLKRLDPARAGSAGAGRERRRFGMGQFGHHGGTAARVNFYVREPGEDIPQPEDVVRDAGATHVYRVQLDNLYDADNDPRGIVENAINADEMEEEISDAGFDGIYYRNPAGIDQPVAVVFDIGKKKIPVEPVEDGVIASRGARNPQIDTPEFRRWFGDSKVVDKDGRPLVVYRGEHGEDTSGDMQSRLGSVTFTDDPEVASLYAVDPNDWRETPFAPRVTAAYLRIERPIFNNQDDPFVELSWLEQSLGRDEAIRIARKFAPYIEGTGKWIEELSEEFDSVDDMLDREPDRIAELYFDAYRLLDDADEVARMKAAGFDGAIHVGNGDSADAIEYRVFDPRQVKSATGNSGAFDPSNPSIVASRRTPADARRERNSLLGRLAAAGYRMGNATQPQQQTGGRFVRLQYAADNVRTALQDKMLPLLRAQERVAENGPAVTSITLDDAMNAYRMENLMHGAVKNGLDRVHQSYIQPIQDAIRKSPFTMAMFEDYLYAKAAPERNAEIAKINPAMPDSGSGISTKLAKDILSGAQPGAISGEVLTAGARALFSQLEPLVRKMRDEVLDNMVSAGQITPALADQLRKKYPNYIPMRGKDGELDESRPARGRGISQPRSSGLRRALGRGDTNVPQNIMGELVGDLQRSIVAKEKGKVARAMLRFAMAHQQPDLYTVEPVDLEWKFSEATGEAYLGVKRRGEDVDASMIVMHEGKPVYLRFVDPALRDAVLNMSVNDMTAMARWLGWINRWRSAVLTRYNPAFTPVNMFRDLQFGLVAVAAELGAAAAARTAKLYPGAMRAAFRHASRQRGDASKPNAQKSMDDWAAEFYETGASTGLTHVDDVVNLQRRLVAASSSVMELAAGGRPIAAVAETLRRVGGPIVDAVENANEASENALRLAVYIEQRQRGISRDRAAEYAKNVTINFNRKGNATNFLNALYLFFNAAMQGTHAVIRVLRNRKVQVYLAGLAGLQGLLAAQMMGDDDDDGITDWDAIPDYVKRTSLIIPINGGEDYFALPMPYGFNVFTYLGGRGTQRMMLGDRPTDSSVLLDLLKATTEAFSPVPFHDGYRSLFGDQIGFMMGLAANTDDFGSPITQRDPFPDYPVPAALEGKVTTPRAYHVAAQMLAKLGGADLDERIPPVGYLDIAPEQLEAVTEYFGGGLANLANRGSSWLEQMSAGNLEGATNVISKLPIASRLIGHVDHQRAISDRYYGERGEFKRHRDIVSQRLEGGASLEEAVADRPPEYVAGMRQARYKRSGRTATGRRYRKGQPRTDAAGLPVIEEAEGHAGLALKAAEKRVREINQAIRRIRAGDMTNEELVDLYVARSQDFQGVGLRDERYTGGHPDLGLPNDYIRDVKAPARVRNRAIAILQELREAHQQRFLKHLERDRRRGDEQ